MSNRSNRKSGHTAVVLLLVLLLVGANVLFLKAQGVTLDDVSFKGGKTAGDDNTTSVISFVEEPSLAPESEEIISEPESVETREKVVLEHPYYIKVDKGAQIVTVYTTNEEGKYEKVVRQMLCSSCSQLQKFPDGYYPLKEHRNRWANMFSATGEPSYAQYATRISGYFLFHSVTYSKKDVHTLNYSRFNNLGKNVSAGCIRLTVENAKWIYENCNPGTIVEVCVGEPQPELVKRLREELGIADGKYKKNYDPTDPEIEGHITQYPDPDPQPDPYAPLYDYNIKFSPECQFTRNTTTTTPAPTTTTKTTKAPDPQPEPSPEPDPPAVGTVIGFNPITSMTLPHN
ncbi:MAG: L,D-transpeptidase [Clostridia bacterium]|nr:L,D-transpeptidase [Clostridia bacterium]